MTILDGKVALIATASSGIGEGISKAFGQGTLGASLVCDIKPTVRADNASVA